MQTFTAVHREFIVESPLEPAWHYFARAAEWPSWHRDLRRVTVVPAGELGAESVATLHMRKGPDTTFQMVEFDPYRHWKWVAKMLWLRIEYDHRFESVDAGQTRIVLHIEIRGLGKPVFGRMVAAATNRSLDRGLPLLAEEMKSAAAAGR